MTCLGFARLVYIYHRIGQDTRERTSLYCDLKLFVGSTRKAILGRRGSIIMPPSGLRIFGLVWPWPSTSWPPKLNVPHGPVVLAQFNIHLALESIPSFLLRDACISAAYAVVRCLSVTFVYCVGAAKKYNHSCYGMWIGNRTQAFEWYPFSMTWSNLQRRFQGRNITQRQITLKPYKIQL